MSRTDKKAWCGLLGFLSSRAVTSTLSVSAGPSSTGSVRALPSLILNSRQHRATSQLACDGDYAQRRTSP